MSQIGYMFLALGVQAWDAAIFHLMTHAFFKALLFLASGSVILACHHEQNIFKMGGLRKSIPLVYLCFLVGGAALSALPLVTAGFFSKDEILAGAMANGHINLMVAGLVGAFMTSLYTFRMIFIVFHGKEQIHAHAVKGVTHSLPLIVLLILSTFVWRTDCTAAAGRASANDGAGARQHVDPGNYLWRGRGGRHSAGCLAMAG